MVISWWILGISSVSWGCSVPPHLSCSVPWGDIMMYVWGCSASHTFHDILPHGTKHSPQYSRNLLPVLNTHYTGWSFLSSYWNSQGNNHASLLAHLFIYSYKSDFLENIIRSGHRKRIFTCCSSTEIFRFCTFVPPLNFAHSLLHIQTGLKTIDFPW